MYKRSGNMVKLPVDVFNKMIKEGKFGDVVLFGWFTVELMVNLMVLGEYNLLPYNENDERQKLLIDNIELDFDKKYRFLKKRSAFTTAETAKIDEFRTVRNRLFHANVKEFMKNFFDEERQKELMALSVDATHCALNAYNRKFPDKA